MYHLKNKKAFTLVELLAVIIILAILIIIVAPNVVNLSGNTKVSLHDSKVKTLETAGEKYGNLNLNDYKDCKNDSGSSYLNNKCTVSIRDLVLEGFITADDDLNNIIDPETNEPMDGSVLLCYNPKEVNVYASYLKKAETPQCKDINVQTGASLALSSGEGIGYNGGNPIEVRILKTGKMTTSCTSSDPKVSCKIEGSTLKMTIEKDPSFTTGSRLVKIEVKGAHSAGTLTQTYNLTIYPTSIFIDKSQNDQLCMESGTTIEYPLEGNNMGTIDISSDKDILEGTIKENKSLILSAKDSTGIDTLTLKEGNGNAEVSISKNIFKLKLDKEMPTELLLGNKEQFTLDYGGNDSVRISVIPIEGDPAIKLYETDENKLVDSLSLEGTSSTFNLKAVKAGKVKIVIEGSNCGRREYEIDVANLYVEKKEAILYFGGSVFETNIVGAKNDTFRCSSSDASAVKCEIKGSTLKLTPGTKETENATVQITGANGGFDTVNVKVRATSLSLVDKSGTPISKVCANIDTGSEQEININARNAGTITIDSISDNLLANATISNNKVTPVNRLLGDEDTFSSPYKQGYNTGITKIRIKESNGNKTASFDYYIYKLNMANNNNNNIKISTNTTEQYEVITRATGNISAISSHPDIASVETINPNYSYEVNKDNKSIIKITGHTIGTATITIKGTDCGTLVINVEVVGKEYYITLKPSEYTTAFDNLDGINNVCTKTDENKNNACVEVKAKCTTKNSDNSCEVTLPDFLTTSEYKINGYSIINDATNPGNNIKKIGTTVRVDDSTNGTVYYAHSLDQNKPECVILESMSTIKYKEIDYYTLSCYEPGSGSNSILTPQSFEITNPSVAEIVSVDPPNETIDSEFGRVGYTYKIGLRGKSLDGEFDFKLKANQVVDKFGNGNDELVKKSLFSAEYRGYRHWNIGKDNAADITAILYVNKDLPEEIKKDDPDDTYTLILYGTGATKSFDESSIIEDIPWIRDGYQEYITNVIINEGITILGDNIFQSLYNMNRVSLADSIEEIGKSSFNMSISLKELEMPSNLKTIGQSAFENCKSLTRIQFNDKLKTISDAAFLNHSLVELIIPKSVKTLGSMSFKSASDNMTLKKLEFENEIQLENISSYAFENHILSELTIPRTVKIIGMSAFSQYSPRNSSLKNLYFESNSQLVTISTQAFRFCNLSQLELPNSLKSIGLNAFSGVGDELTSLNIGPNVDTLKPGFIIGKGIMNYTIDPRNENFVAVDNVIFNKSMTTLIRFPDAYFLVHNEYSVPDGVTRIEDSAFGGMNYYIESNDNVLNFPSSVKELNINNNYDGTFVSRFNIDNEYYTSRDGIIYDKEMTTALKMPVFVKLDKYEVPSSVKIIGKYFGYANMSVREVTIPNSVEEIKDFAFATEPSLAFSTINLYTNTGTTLNPTFLTNINLKSSVHIKRTVNVKNTSMKNIIEGYYGNNISVNLES